VSGERSPALIIRFSDDTTNAHRESLVALLAEHDLIAIHEDDVAAPRTWTAHFATAAGRDGAAAAIGAFPSLHSPLEAIDIEDEDWARRTQADLPAVRVGRILVAPPWDVPDGYVPPPSPTRPAPDGAIVVVIEPSRGFGTGHHQSTRLCLALLQSRPVSGQTVLDVGTGSGLLAIIAARLGAAYVSAIDVDPDAIENARENIASNGVEGIVEAHVRDIAAPAPPAADLVLANLTGTLLARHAGPLGAAVKPGGCLIVAGFTVDEKRLVADAFAPDFGVTETAEEDGWWAYVLTQACRS
jgi:ribosomal protein L11 methyltransferase